MIRTYTLILLLLITTLAQAQWVTYTPSNTKGLCGTIVTSVAQNGADMWFGTDSGVVKYDPSNLVWYYHTISNGLGDNFVYKLLWSDNNTLWAGTNSNGVSKYDKVSKKWTIYNKSKGLAANIVRDIVKDVSGNLWFGTYGGGLSKYDGSSWKTITTTDGLAGNMVLSLFIDKDNHLWCGTTKGLSFYTDTSWINYTISDGLPVNTITSIAQDKDGNIWAGTVNGVAKYNGTSWHAFTTSDGLTDNMVYSIKKDAQGNLWFATRNGLSKFDGSSWVTFKVSNGLGSNEVFSIYQDNNQKYWFGLVGNGVSVYDGNVWKTLYRNSGFSGNIYDMTKGNNNDLWLACSYGGVYRFDGSQWINYKTPFNNSSIYCTTKDNSGNIWFGSYNGAYKYDGSSWTQYTTSGGLYSNDVESIFKDSKGNLWMTPSTFYSNDKISKFDGTNFSSHTVPLYKSSHRHQIAIGEDPQGRIWLAGYSHNYEPPILTFDGQKWDTLNPFIGYGFAYAPDINNICGAANGDMWLATTAGAFLYSNNTWTKFTEPGNNSSSPYVYKIAEDGSGGIWFGTYSKLSLYKNGKWTYYTDLDGYTPYSIQKILTDSSGFVWVAHSYSDLSKGDLSLLTSFPANEKVKEKPGFDNYPNPFSSATTIRYTLSEPAHVALSVYDIYGRVVAGVEDEYVAEGAYNLRYDASQLPDGIYICELIIDNKRRAIQLIKTN